MSRKVASEKVRLAIESESKLWTADDFPDLSRMAANQALSRLCRNGKLNRVSRGVYVSGNAATHPTTVARKLSHIVHPAGQSAAKLLGLAKSNPVTDEVAVCAENVPTALLNSNLTVHVRKNTSREGLSDREAALIEIVRTRGSFTELSPTQMTKRIVQMFTDAEQQTLDYVRLVSAALHEPPRVRAILGAIGEEIGADANLVSKLRNSLNRTSRFDFGKFMALNSATEWQAS